MLFLLFPTDPESPFTVLASESLRFRGLLTRSAESEAISKSGRRFSLLASDAWLGRFSCVRCGLGGRRSWTKTSVLWLPSSERWLSIKVARRVGPPGLRMDQGGWWWTAGRKTRCGFCVVTFSEHRHSGHVFFEFPLFCLVPRSFRRLWRVCLNLQLISSVD